VLGRNGGNVTTVLYHTVNGGATWSEEPGSTTGSNGGAQVVGFTNHDDGWRQQFALGSSGPYLLETTADGGSTWRELPQVSSNGGCEYAEDVFANPRDGFAGSIFSTPGPEQAEGMTAPQAWLWQTTDGGQSWLKLTLPPPPGLAGAAALYDLPVFFNTSDGVVPVLYADGNSTRLAFFTSSDAGLSWHFSNSLPTSSTARRAANSGTCGPQVAGELPLVSTASPTTWWVIGTSDSSVSVTTNGGQSWTTTPVSSLGFVSQDGNAVQSFHAFNSSISWISTSNETTGTALWQTTDGGQTWSQVTTAGIEAAATATSMPSCSNTQLSISAGRSGAGLGHNGEALLFTNVSQSGCTLYGYPGVAALDAAGTQILQAARTPLGYLGGLMEPTSIIPLVPLSPGQSASALVEGTDNPVGPGPNPPPCPVDSGLLVTAPNTTHSVHLPGGPSLCSGLQIHPVVPGTSGDETG
jgi:photosystem II stability/assembly factor-like uncharacterized protein